MPDHLQMWLVSAGYFICYMVKIVLYYDVITIVFMSTNKLLNSEKSECTIAGLSEVYYCLKFYCYHVR